MRRRPTDPADPVLVAGAADLRPVAPHPVIFVEHGSGQSYDGAPEARGNVSYSGGTGRESVVLHIVPNESVAARCRATQPEVPVAVVGCPRLDRFHGNLGAGGHPRRVDLCDVPPRREGALRTQSPGWANGGDRVYGEVGPVVAVTFHWHLPLVPETLSAWPHYDRALPGLAQRFRLLGHGHPRLWGRIERRWRVLGVDSTACLDRVLDEAAVLVADNTSAMWEAASVGIPLVVLDAPWYRPHVDHGLRFWSHADAGVRIADPADLVDAVALALTDPPEVRERRRAAVAATYAYTDGHAAERAAAAVLQLLQARR